MKPKKADLPSVYEEKEFEKAGYRINRVTLTLWVFLLLALFRFINLGLWYFVTKGEITGNRSPASDKRAQYIFLGISDQTSAENALTRVPRPSPIQAAVYTNLLQPSVFIVNNLNSSRHTTLDLGRMVVTPGPGQWLFKLHLSGTLTQMGQGDVSQANIDPSLFSSLTAGRAGKISFITKAPEKAKYLHIPYLVYFFLPLVSIFIFFNLYSRAVFIGFFYYTGMFLLFDFKRLFLTLPFQTLITSMDLVFSDFMEAAIAAAVALLLSLLGVAGILSWKNRREPYKESLIILFFLLLPLFLRF